MAKSESRTSLLKAAGSRRAAGAQPQPRGGRARDGRGRGGQAGGESSQEALPGEPSARRPLCHPGAREDGARGAGKLSHGRGESQPEPAEGGPRRGGSGKEAARPARHHHHPPPHGSHGHPQDHQQLSDRDGEEAEEDFFLSHRQRSSRESLKLSEGASPLSKSSSKYSTKSSGSERSVEADPLFHQLHPMLSSVFGQVRGAEPPPPPPSPSPPPSPPRPRPAAGHRPPGRSRAVNALLPGRASPEQPAPLGRCGATRESPALPAGGTALRPLRGTAAARGRCRWCWRGTALCQPPGEEVAALPGEGESRGSDYHPPPPKKKKQSQKDIYLLDSISLAPRLALLYLFTSPYGTFLYNQHMNHF